MANIIAILIGFFFTYSYLKNNEKASLGNKIIVGTLLFCVGYVVGAFLIGMSLFFIFLFLALFIFSLFI